MKNFEEYLTHAHAEQYHGLDDEMPDDFDNWLTNLDVYEVLEMVKDYEWNYDHKAGKNS